MTPLVLLVAFLGSGKTTFLKALLPLLKEQCVVPRVIINDYQNAEVDAEQLAALVDRVEAISGSCVCCSSRDDLVRALEGFEHGESRVVIVETNGTTDSEELIEMLSLESGLRKFSLPVQLSVIDAQRWQKRFWHNGLEREQARTATHLTISRLDVVTEQRKAAVEASLAKCKVTGTLVTPESFSREILELCELMSSKPERVIEACGDHEHDHHGEVNHHHEHDNHHFASLELPLPPFVPRKDFQKLLRQLPDEVIRAMGLVRFAEIPTEFFVFQKVEGFDEPQFFPVGQSPKLCTPVALFIGPRLTTSKLQAAIDSLPHVPKV
jgi:G3E family GTPase